jgi:predicted anti-sigma-YlaC factor YlaD
VTGSGQDGAAIGAFDVSADEVACQQFVELVTDYFEGTLSGRTLSQVEEHLVMCDWCATYADQMRVTIETLGALKAHQAGKPSESVLAALHANRGIAP